MSKSVTEVLKQVKLFEEYLEKLGWKHRLKDHQPYIDLYVTDPWAPHYQCSSLEEGIGYASGYMDALRGGSSGRISHDILKIPYKSVVIPLEDRGA